jgi:hypothetical protein
MKEKVLKPGVCSSIVVNPPTQVDVAILEVGIGGEYDATNVINKPIVCGIASLGFDHQAILGETLPEIAWHKGGIAKVRGALFGLFWLFGLPSHSACSPVCPSLRLHKNPRASKLSRIEPKNDILRCNLFHRWKAIPEERF